MVHDEVTKEPPVVRAALCVYSGVFYFFTFTVAILTTSRSLIIRTARRTTIIRERLKIVLIWFYVFRPIIGLIKNKSRDNFEQYLNLVQDYKPDSTFTKTFTAF
jgi:hypothetical protein